MQRIALIPARAGSKRIPGKNVRPFCGRPIVEYSLEAAAAAGTCDRIVVSTDDREVAEIASRYGATIVERPAPLADDMAPLIDVVLQVLDELEPEPAEVCLILATVPFLTPELIDEAHALLDRRDVDAVATMASFEVPIWQGFERKEDGTVRMLWPEHMFTRTQDLPEALYDAGQLYWLRSAQVRAERKIFLDRLIPIEVPSYLVQDIDTEDDWRRAELLYKVWKSDAV